MGRRLDPPLSGYRTRCKTRDPAGLAAPHPAHVRSADERMVSQNPPLTRPWLRGASTRVVDPADSAVLASLPDQGIACFQWRPQPRSPACWVTTSCASSAPTSMPPTTGCVTMRGSAEGMAGTARRLTESRSAQALFERDSAIAHAGHRLAALDIAKDRLLVGRLDLTDGTCLYVGRLAVADEHGDPLVVDWRAPAAEPFYRALPHDPMGVVRRRHFRWRHGELVGLEDEVFDVTAAGEAGLHLVGEGALMAALDAPRTGRMQDVVATIQAEQDVVIRRPRAGVTVVQGAPGTGKTAVALHRAAYLLYAERAHLAGAVLFVGPSTTFLRYVEDVVPSLGEDRVVLATPADLGPAVAVSKVDPPAAAAVKGDLRMVDVLARAVRAHERAPRAGIELWAGRFRLVVDHDHLAAIVDDSAGDGRRRTTAAGRWWSASSCGRWRPRTGTASSATTGSAASARKQSGTRHRSST